MQSQSIVNYQKVFFLPLYEDYLITTDPAKLYKYIETNLSDSWNNKQLSTHRTRIRRYKPIDFTKLYKKIDILRKHSKKSSKSQWIRADGYPNFSKNSLNISQTSSYLLRAINNSQLYKHQQQIPHYKSLYLKGVTFDKENIFDKQKKVLNSNALFFYYSSNLRKKVQRQQTIEKFLKLA